jgi:hypothetical protein
MMLRVVLLRIYVCWDVMLFHLMSGSQHVERTSGKSHPHNNASLPGIP